MHTSLALRTRIFLPESVSIHRILSASTVMTMCVWFTSEILPEGGALGKRTVGSQFTIRAVTASQGMMTYQIAEGGLT